LTDYIDMYLFEHLSAHKETPMSPITGLLTSALDKTLLAFAHNWIYLLASVLIGVLIKVTLDRERVAAFLQRHQKGGVAIATAVAVGTPLCSCGTTAVVIGMMASMMPWAPIVAFMVASPLTSPEGLPYTAGLFGWPFSIAYFTASILLGLGGGLAAAILEKRGWLRDQVRLISGGPPARLEAPGSAPVASECGCASTQPQTRPTTALAVSGGCCGSTQAALAASVPLPGRSTLSHPVGGQAFSPARPRLTPGLIARHLMQDGPRLLTMFFTFAYLGYFLNGLIPSTWITALFGGGHAYSVPLAATLGLPFYINAEASLPLVRAMLDSGMSQGAALAFLIAGAGTSLGAIGGALTIARWRVIALVIGTLWLGAILAGLAYDLLLALGM
jgi:uncharacterized membrane protein YraQ (UPF0718 family)